MINKINEILKKYNTNNPYDIIEKDDIILILHPLKNVNGFYQYVLDQHIIYINEALDNNKKNFVLAHELGHLFLHEKVNRYNCSDIEIKQIENEADLFANSLLNYKPIKSD